MLSIFARVAAGERMPAREQLRPQLTRVWRVLLWPVAAAAFLVVFAAGGDQGRAACRDGMQRGIQAVCPASFGKQVAPAARARLRAAHRNRPCP